MAYFATEYTIHFDDTMAYGSHHFLTAFKFQCASRESFLFGERVFDMPGVKEALQGVHLLTADAYARNLKPAKLGDRVVILLSLEEWGRSSARFCYRVLGAQGQSICAGFQTLICADAETQLPIPMPPPLRQALDALREIEEPRRKQSFRCCALAGGSQLDSLFGSAERELALRFLSERYPSPKLVAIVEEASESEESTESEPQNDVFLPSNEGELLSKEVWVFSGQSTFDSTLLSERVLTYARTTQVASEELQQCARLAQEMIGGDAFALIRGVPFDCAAAVASEPELSQVAIYLQNILGARLRQAQGYHPGILLGHSFGEIAALGVGGCFDLLTGVRIVCSRVRAVQNYAPPGGGLLVVSANRNFVTTEAGLLGLRQIVIAGRNHATQTVASGPIEELECLRKCLDGFKVSATMLASPTSFHHPNLRKAAAHWLEELRTLALKAPSQAIYSPIGRRFISAEDDIAAVLASHLVKPFDLERGLSEVLKEQVTRFVDCGSTGSLSRLISKIGVGDAEVCRVDESDVKSSRPASSHAVAHLFPEPQISVLPRTATSANSPNHGTTSLDLASPASETLQPLPGQSLVPPIAIVGQGCILPGGASSPAKLFEAISEQRNGIVDQRHYDPHWSEEFYAEKLLPDRSYSHLSGRVNDDDIAVPPGVEAEIFNRFSRTQRLLCLALVPCLPSLKGADRILCLIGATADGFEDQDDISSLRYMGMDPSDRELNARLGNAPSAEHTPHSAVQEVFDSIIRPGLRVTLVDAACASSLYTVALGMQALESRKTDAVIAGGFFCPGPGNSCLFSQFRGTTATGCRPFDADADGVVFSEGAALVTLRRVADAESLNLPMHAIVRGAGLSSDGRSTSANVPQSKGQSLSLKRCYDNYAIDPASISAIEGHGTSTPVGDGTEVETLRQFFEGKCAQPIPLHSLKGLLGHAGWAAGTASVIAASEYLRRGVFPAQAGFQKPSKAIQSAVKTLSVSAEPVSLPKQQGRIAIDGFGFGGANAHLVLEALPSPGISAIHQPVARRTLTDRQNELVFIACHQEQPTIRAGRRWLFDRGSVKLPKKFVVLPELADDMDISQTLTVIVADKVIAKIPQLDEAWRRETSVILAMRGKTARGIEATARIMTPRFRRKLQGSDQHIQLLSKSYDSARPSGPYTLQCMMPNVAAGRASLLLNLNGPNFVVDSAANSLEAALSSAALLLQSEHEGTKLAIIAAVEANANANPEGQSSAGVVEFAAAFAVTTRQFAEARKWKVIAGVDETLRIASQKLEQWGGATPIHDKLNALLESLGEKIDPVHAISSEESDAALVPTESDCHIHVPVWVQKPASDQQKIRLELTLNRTLAIVPAHALQVEALLAALPKFSASFLIAVVGRTGEALASYSANPSILTIDIEDSRSISAALDRIQVFGADVITVIDSVATWNFTETLSSMASDNCLCEFLFLVAQREWARLSGAQAELWGLMVGAWNGEVHPRSGPIAGLLKSINREYPSARTGTICVANTDLAHALECLQTERAQQDGEQEIVWDQKVRLVRRLRRPSLSHRKSKSVKLDANSVVVATGGARGVTAIMLEALLNDYQCTVIALGRSPLEEGPDNWNDVTIEPEFYQRCLRKNPKATAAELRRNLESTRAKWEAHHTIQRLSKLGGRVEYLVADVTNHAQVTNAIEQIVSRYGNIDLVVHGAGVQLSKRLEHRTLAEFRQTFSIKVAGLRNILDCCSAQLGKMVDTHVLTSAYSIFGNDGQHDYGAANETLDRLCVMKGSDPMAASSSMAWLAWEGIGMTRGSEYRALAKRRGLSVVDEQLGKRLFRAALAGQHDWATHIPMTKSEHVEYGIKTIPQSRTQSNGAVIEVGVHLGSMECMPFHRVRDVPTLPGAWILNQLVKAALQLATEREQVTNVSVENLSFMRFVRLANNQEPNLRVIAERTGNAIDVWMVADVLHPTGIILSKDVVCAKARLTFSGGDLLPPTSSIAWLAGYRSTKSVRDPYCEGNGSDVTLSGPFDCLSEIEISDSHRRAAFRPQHMFSHLDDIPALLLDAAWRVGAMYAIEGESDLFVPVQIGRMLLPVGKNSSHHPISSWKTAPWEIRSTVPRSENRDVRWDRTEVFDREGTLKMVVEDALAMRLA